MNLFALLGIYENLHTADEQTDLFGFSVEAPLRRYEQIDIRIVAALFSSSFDLSLLSEPARRFFELSVNAFDVFVHAWMSELPIEAEMISYGRRIIALADKAGGEYEKQRRAAEQAAADRGEADTLAVMAAAYKVQREVHRLLGLLRFNPDPNGIYTARCSPDHFILPAFGGHFTSRFRDTAWAVIDEKRRLSICRLPGEPAKITAGDGAFAGGIALNTAHDGDEWEDLWRHYHKTINNESRNNPGLQRQFMPKRYWKYLPEM